MNVCLRDRTLFLLAAGDGTAQARAHLQSCLRCARRYQQLTRQLASIERTLRETDPSAVTAPPVTSRRYWVPLTAALATALLLVWGGLWAPSPERQPAKTTSAHTGFERRWEKDWTSVFFAAEDRLTIAPPAPVSSEVYLQAAFAEGGWPCEWQEPFLTPTCEIYPFPLALAMQSLEEVMYE
ncbi:MAG: hypothetical protein HYZ50_22610 [Deltaproteobacteria bacterium]|nr:hypothetical protein [Deltaproteobacteria bacterium]